MSPRKIVFFKIFLLQIFLCFQTANCQTNFKKIISFLASQEMAGRYPGTTADSIVQSYIADEFKSNNLKTLSSLNSFYQKFQLPIPYSYEGDFLLKTANKTELFINGKDFVFTSKSKEDSLNLEIVFIGYGITNNQKDSIFLNHSMKDKLVIAFQSFPNKYDITVKNWIRNNRNNSISDILKTGAKAAMYVLPENYKIKPRKYKQSRRKQSKMIITTISNQTFQKIVEKKVVKEFENSLQEMKTFQAFHLKEKSIRIQSRRKKHYPTTQTSNIIGLQKGTNDQYIIIGAHHDHLGMKGKNDSIHPGANDNASGVAMLLELANYFKNDKTNCNILFTAFAAEEKGMLGSKYFWNNSPINKDKIKAMINLDMVGVLQNDTLYHQTHNVSNSSSIYEQTLKMNKNLFIKETKMGLSDSYIFLHNSIPTFYLTTGFPATLHTPQDKEENINYKGMEKVLSFLISLTKVVDKSDIKK